MHDASHLYADRVIAARNGIDIALRCHLDVHNIVMYKMLYGIGISTTGEVANCCRRSRGVSKSLAAYSLHTISTAYRYPSISCPPHVLRTKLWVVVLSETCALVKCQLSVYVTIPMHRATKDGIHATLQL